LEGEITVLPNHLPLVSILAPGELVVRKNKDEVYMAVAGGFVTVHPKSQVVILADSAERAEELSIEAIEAARERARKFLEEKRGRDDVAFADAAAAMQRELARLKVAKKHKTRGARTTAPGGE
jgi:F-type H+-transporting ATPase subunit epsilon